MKENIKWFKNENYYKVRGWLLKRGFKKTNNYGFYDDSKTSGWQEFDDGVEKVVLRCTIIKNGKGNLQCDKVYDFQTKIYDNNTMNNTNKELYENIMSRISKVLGHLNESAFVVNPTNLSYVAEFIYLAMYDPRYSDIFDEEIYEYFINKDADDILNMLYSCNILSVNKRYRYPDEKIPYMSLTIPEYKNMRALLAKVSDIQIYKYMCCWEYQSEERESDTLTLVSRLINNFKEYLNGKYGVDDIDKTPDYNNAKWD